MMFSSGKHAYLTFTLYECHLHGPECYGCVYEREFTQTHYLNNPANPILHAARLAPGENIMYADLPEWPSREQINHASKVLQRLARLREEA